MLSFRTSGCWLLIKTVGSDGALKVEALVDFDVFLPTAHYQPGGLRNLGFDTYSYLSSNDLIFHLRSIGNGIFFEPSLYFSGSTENFHGLRTPEMWTSGR